ncbi:glycosyltransferase family 2 protein [Salinigranum halophilum]|uniref:glycosyltransferase family 2 protein n=1 Tax=Salinigranum halophilum TaxID=2565931 RepID=UPI0010A82CDA|nr:glycosyltransferase family 2 protein [Salinigranum halophilum]
MSQLDLTNGSSTVGRHTDSETGIVVGLPAYNEAVGIGSVILSAQEYADEVIVVDDGSTDRTVEIAESAGATVVKHESNEGKGGAVKTIFESASRQQPEALVLLDADGQHVPTDIQAVAQPVLDGDADISIGSRYLESKGGDETPLYRRFGQQVLDVLTTGRSARDLTDTQSGFRALSPQAIDDLKLTTDGIGVETEMIRDASDKGLRMTEVPIDVRYEGIDGQTYNPLHHGLTVVNFVLQLVRDRHPLVFFGLPGLVLILLGTLYGLDGILVYRATGDFYPAKVFVAGFLTIIGCLATFTGMMLNSLSNKLAQVTTEN